MKERKPCRIKALDGDCEGRLHLSVLWMDPRRPVNAIESLLLHPPIDHCNTS